MTRCLLILASLALATPLYAADVADLLTQEVEKFQVNDTFEKAVAGLASAAKVRIEVDWTRLEAAGVTKQTKLALRARNEKLQTLLDMLVLRVAEKDKPLSWVVDGQSIRITTQDAVLGRGRATAGGGTATTQPAAGVRAGSGAVSFNQTALQDVLKFIRDKSGVNMTINWASLEAVGIAKDTPVTVEASKLSVGRVLDLVLDDVSGNRGRMERLYWVIDDGVVVIATGNALNEKTKTQIVDVSDMLMIVPNFKGPKLDLSVTGNGTDSSVDDANDDDEDEDEDEDEDDEPSISEQRARVEEQLINAVKNSIGEEMWKPDGKGTIQIFQGKMIITQTQLGFKLMETAVK